MTRLQIIALFACLSTVLFLLVNYVDMYTGLQIILGLSFLTSQIFFFYYLGKLIGVNWRKIGEAIDDVLL